MKVVVFGLGYVGAVTASGLASLGHEVVGVDVDHTKVELMQAGGSPVIEPGLEEMISKGVASGRLRATTDAREALDRADVTLVCVGTPSTSHGAADLTYLHRALDDLEGAMAVTSPPASGVHTLVIRSTVPPGTVQDVVGKRLPKMAAVGWQVAAAMCPEFLREGTGVHDFLEPSLVVVGTDDARAGAVLVDLFGYSKQPIHVVATKTAESVKYACNAFHATKVSFANDMGRALRPLGVDSREVMRLLCEDTVLNISRAYLRPGFAYGGSCLPKDLRSLVHLARQSSLDVPQLIGTGATNDLMVREVVDRIVDHTPHRIAMLGLSFKQDTDDLRESPYLELAERLVGKGFELRIFDPIVNPARLTGANLLHLERRLPHLNRLLKPTACEALDGADIALVATTDAEACEALLESRPPILLDFSGRLGPDIEQLPGYEGVGW
jgi:GDP-mannose 6-dehydrogenase